MIGGCEHGRSGGVVRVVVFMVCVLGGMVFSGCVGSGQGKERAIVRGAAPGYAESAARYNEHVSRLERVWARAVVRLTYVDPEGELRTEQGDGFLQVIRPDRLALSLSKAGMLLFWLGCDAQRYWWIDLTGDEGVASFGRHEKFETSARDRLGLAIAPLDMIRLLGTSPMATGVGVEGATQWSRDGRLLGLTSRRAGGGFERVWVEPETMAPRMWELFDADERLVMVSELEGEMPVDVQGSGGLRPRMASRVTATHVESGTRIRLSLAGGRDTPVPEAFELDAILRAQRISRAVDLDVRR